MGKKTDAKEPQMLMWCPNCRKAVLDATSKTVCPACHFRRQSFPSYYCKGCVQPPHNCLCNHEDL